MKIEFCEKNEGHEEVLELLKSNHPDYETEVKSCIEYCHKCQGHVIAKIGNNYYDAPDPKGLYDKIIDHFFRLPNSFIG